MKMGSQQVNLKSNHLFPLSLVPAKFSSLSSSDTVICFLLCDLLIVMKYSWGRYRQNKFHATSAGKILSPLRQAGASSAM